MSRSTLDILFVLAMLSFGVVVLPLILAYALAADGIDGVVRMLASWTGTSEVRWILYGVRQLAMVLPYLFVSFIMAMLLRVSALSVALLAALSALVARHLSFDNFDLSGLV